jgi:replicative superfamily II helicase
MTDDNVFLGSASGSGKQACALLAILRIIKEHPSKKVVYIAPLESLCL